MPRDVSADELLARLGPAEAELDHPLAARLQRPIGAADETLIDHVFASRGLALLIGRAATGARRIMRIRGFEVMPVSGYREGFVDLPGPRFFPQ